MTENKMRLLKWCQNQLNEYPNISIQNFSTSWKNGLAFNALIHKFKPDLINYHGLDSSQIFYNNYKAFKTAEIHFGIPSLLDAKDMENCECPERLSIITYVSQFYNCLKEMKPEGGYKINKFKNTNNGNLDFENISSRASINRLSKLTCSICSEKVYLLERYIADDKLYHRKCYRTHQIKNIDTEPEVIGDYLNIYGEINPKLNSHIYVHPLQNFNSDNHTIDVQTSSPVSFVEESDSEVERYEDPSESLSSYDNSEHLSSYNSDESNSIENYNTNVFDNRVNAEYVNDVSMHEKFHIKKNQDNVDIEKESEINLADKEINNNTKETFDKEEILNNTDQLLINSDQNLNSLKVIEATDKKIQIEPIEATDNKIQIEPIEATDNKIQIEPIEATDNKIQIEPIEATDNKIQIEPIEVTEKMIQIDNSIIDKTEHEDRVIDDLSINNSERKFKVKSEEKEPNSDSKNSQLTGIYNKIESNISEPITVEPEFRNVRLRSQENLVVRIKESSQIKPVKQRLYVKKRDKKLPYSTFFEVSHDKCAQEQSQNTNKITCSIPAFEAQEIQSKFQKKAPENTPENQKVPDSVRTDSGQSKKLIVIHDNANIEYDSDVSSIEEEEYDCIKPRITRNSIWRKPIISSTETRKHKSTCVSIEGKFRDYAEFKERLEELNSKQSDIEVKARNIQQKLWEEKAETPLYDSLLVKWLDLVEEKDKIFYEENALYSWIKDLKLQEMKSKLETQIRMLPSTNYNDPNIIEKEKELVAKLIETVNKRAELVDAMHEEHIRRLEISKTRGEAFDKASSSQDNCSLNQQSKHEKSHKSFWKRKTSLL